MSPDNGRGGEEGRVSGALQWGTGNLGHWEGTAYLARRVKEKSKLRGRREVCGKWNTNVPHYLGFFLSSKTGQLDFATDPVPSTVSSLLSKK